MEKILKEIDFIIEQVVKWEDKNYILSSLYKLKWEIKSTIERKNI